MANATRLPCKKFGCPTLVMPGQGGFCPAHTRAKLPRADYRFKSRSRAAQNQMRRADPIDGPLDRFYSTARWQRVRNWHLASNPLCIKCGQLGQIVDHILPRRDGGAELDPDNLQTLCRQCHATKTHAETLGRAQAKSSTTTPCDGTQKTRVEPGAS